MGHEVFRPIVVTKNGKVYDFTGFYEISNYGRIRSLERVVTNNIGTIRYYPSVERKPFKDKDGYLIISLWKGGYGGLFKVHRLVAEMFLPNPNGLPIINHKDENKTNNYVDLDNPDCSNLEWCDVKYNRRYGHCEEKRVASFRASYTKERMEKTLETRRKNKCVGAPRAILQIDPITDEIVGEYPSISEAQRIGFGSIWNALNGRRITAGGYKWRYK